MPCYTSCPGSDLQDMRLCDCRRYPLCELEQHGVRCPLKRVGRVVLIAAPLLAWAVPQSRWTSLRGIARRERYPCTHRAHIAGGCQTCVSHSKIIRWVCGQLIVCMTCGWLFACLSVAGCLASAFQFWLLARCLLLVARVLVPVFRQGRPPLRSVSLLSVFVTVAVVVVICGCRCVL